MKKGDQYYIRIDTRTGSLKADKNTLEQHMAYLDKLAKDAELYGGSFNENSSKAGMIVFKARDFKTADNLCKNDPIIIAKLYTYKLYEWTILLTS